MMQDEDDEDRSCAVCGAEEASACLGCKNDIRSGPYYCGEECQRHDLSDHTPFCGAPKRVKLAWTLAGEEVAVPVVLLKTPDGYGRVGIMAFLDKECESQLKALHDKDPDSIPDDWEEGYSDWLPSAGRAWCVLTAPMKDIEQVSLTPSMHKKVRESLLITRPA